MSAGPKLIDRYRGVVLDVDGVLCRGAQALPHVPDVLAVLREDGVPIALVTNNASRTPAQAAAWLSAMGVHVEADEILTSPEVAVGLLQPGTACVAVGSDGLRHALDRRGVRMLPDDADPTEAAAVVVGFDPDLRYADLRRATLALHAGARFIGTNGDLTFPAADGLWPGNGAILAALTAATGRRPEVVGKPAPALFEAAAARLGRAPLLMVGDRLDTDIAGAAALGWDTALVLTGVTPAAAATARQATWILDDLRGLLAAPAGPAGG